MPDRRRSGGLLGSNQDRRRSGGKPTSPVGGQDAWSHVPPGLPPAPPADASEYRVPSRTWRFWTVLLPCFLTVCWIVVIGFAAGLGAVLSEGVTGPNPRAQAANAYESRQFIAIAVVVALLIAAGLKPRWRRAIALSAWGVFLADIGVLVIIALSTRAAVTR